jgi:hypothetical protein
MYGTVPYPIGIIPVRYPYVNFCRFIFLLSNSTHLTQPLDVAVFGPMKKQWRVVLNQYKDWCMANNVKNVTIPKDRYQKHIFLHSTYMGTFLHTGAIP